MDAEKTPSFLEAWNIDEKDFPASGSAADKLTFCVRYAILAPSLLNTQPWKFVVENDTVRLYADRKRGLAMMDPDDRELLLSCGASLFFLRLAVRYFGFSEQVELLPDPADEDLLALVKLGGQRDDASGVDKTHFPMLTQWRFNRGVFQDREVPQDVVDGLRSAAAEEGGWFHACTESEKKTVCRLIAEGDTIQLTNKNFRRELAGWVHPSRRESGDGLPDYSMGFREVMNNFSPIVVRRFKGPDGKVVRDEEMASGSPVLAVLGSRGGGSLERLYAGQAWAKVVLRAQHEGVSLSYLNQPCEVPELRLRLHDNIAHPGRAQLILRMGYPIENVPPVMRRPLNDVLKVTGGFVSVPETSGAALQAGSGPQKLWRKLLLALRGKTR